ncbi:MAG: YtxH domain-containing protein [Chloroflexi bacterium]|nr:YtxH domain-containing protein [Chloroflexota bacterium]
MADNGSNGWEFAAGFFIGGVVGGLLGAAAALLMAPQAGEDTRAMLREKGIELRDQAEDLSAEARKRAEEASAEARKRAEEASSGLRERSKSLSESARVTLDDRMAQVKEAYETGKQAAEKKMDELRQGIHNPDATTPGASA